MNICEWLKVMGFGIEGAHQEYFRVPEETVVALPSSIAFGEATLIEPLTVAGHALNRSGVQTEDNVLIFGAGTIDHLIMQAAKARGARVAVIDHSGGQDVHRLRCPPQNMRACISR
jgi:threonine dehydrogenase-like Zn-dependent dehydrogenase